MKTFICDCGRKREVEDYVIIVICSHCLKEMKEVKDEVRKV